MKKYIRYFVLLLLCGGFFLLGETKSAKAMSISDQTEFVWEELSDGTVKITGMAFYYDSVSRLEIPESIYGKTVSTIGGWSLASGCNKVEEIVLPDTVLILEEEAFAGLMGMSRISVSEDNPYFVVSDNALYSKDKTKLYWVSPKETEFRIPNGIEWISYHAFLEDSQVESVFISDDVNLAFDKGSAYSLASNIFSECANLKRFVVSATHPDYKTSEGVLYSKDGKSLLLVPRAQGKEVFVVPEGVTGIGSYAFRHCTGIREVVLPDSLLEIGAYTFGGCTGLQQAVIPEMVELIPYYAFFGCTSLREIVLPKNVRFIGGQAFDSCANLSSVVYAGDEVDEIRLAIESGVKWEKSSSESAAMTTDEAMFLWETNNKGNVVITGTKIKKSAVKIVIPNNIDGKTVEEIANRAFSGHERLRSVTIPETVLVIGEEAFYETPALEEIKVAKDNPNYTTAEGHLYNKDITYLIWVTADQAGSFVIPKTVRSMSRLAFSSCKKLTEIHIPGNAKKPEDSFNMGFLFNDNFSQCTSLSAIWVDYNNPYYSSMDGVLCTRDVKRILAVPPALNIKNYEVPYGIQEIGGFSFSGCYKIETVTLPESIVTIELFAFMNCPSIKEISVGHGLTEIGEKAFYYCDALEKVTLPSTLVYMDEWAMEGCYNLTELVLLVEDESLRKAFFYGEEWFGEPSEPGTDRPGDDVGEDQPSGVEDGKDTPTSPEQQQSITEPRSEQLLKQRIRKGTTLLFSYQVTEDNEVIITGLTQMAEKDKKNRILTIPQKINGMPVVGIDGGAFANVPLTYVSMPEGLLEIGRGAFYGCNLSVVTIPASVSYIGSRAFGANHGMREINVAEENEVYSSLGGVLYNKDKTVLVQMPANYPEPHYTIPKSVRVLDEYAFGNCRNLETAYVSSTEQQVKEKVYWNTSVELVLKTFREAVEWVACKFPTMNFVTAKDVSYDLQADGAMKLQYKKHNGQVIYALRSVVDMAYCKDFLVKLQNEVGEITVVLYDEEMKEVERIPLGKTAGIEKISVAPKYKGKLEYVGFMATDEELTDYSAFEAIVYYIYIFPMDPSTEKVSYVMTDLTEKQHYNVEHSYHEDGSLSMAFDRLYGEIKLALPEPIDMSYYDTVGLELESEDGVFALRFYDESFQEIEGVYEIKTAGVMERMHIPTTESMIYGIGLMTCDTSLTDYSDCEATVYSISFYNDKDS